MMVVRWCAPGLQFSEKVAETFWIGLLWKRHKTPLCAHTVLSEGPRFGGQHDVCSITFLVLPGLTHRCSDIFIHNQSLTIWVSPSACTGRQNHIVPFLLCFVFLHHGFQRKAGWPNKWLCVSVLISACLWNRKEKEILFFCPLADMVDMLPAIVAPRRPKIEEGHCSFSSQTLLSKGSWVLSQCSFYHSDQYFFLSFLSVLLYLIQSLPSEWI